jgi:hypothetical protein
MYTMELSVVYAVGACNKEKKQSTEHSVEHKSDLK